MQARKIVGAGVLVLAVALATGCGKSEAEGGAAASGALQEPAATDVAETKPEPEKEFSPAGTDLTLASKPPRRGKALTSNGREQWILDLEVANGGKEKLDGVLYTLELTHGRGEGDAFALHAGEIHFTPPVEPGATGHWSIRMAVRDGHPEGEEGVRVRWKTAERNSRRPPDEVVWKPLDPKNLPPARTVKLDASGNVVPD